MGSTIAFVSGVLLVRELHRIIVLLISTDAFDNIVDLLLNFIFIRPLDITEDIMEFLQDVCERIQFWYINANTGANGNGINFSVFIFKLNPHRLLCFSTVTFQIHIFK